MAKGSLTITRLQREISLGAGPKGKKEDNPEGALKDFKAIIEQEEEKSDWYVSARLLWLMCVLTNLPQGFQGP